jgi:glycosyltransferase involved in cell wall biosynthesis
MNLLFIASELPSIFSENLSPFNIERIAALQHWEKIHIKVVCPIRLTPPEDLVFHFPPRFSSIRQWYLARKCSPSKMQYGSIEITYLKWHGLPKRYFWSFEGRIMFYQLNKSLVKIVKEFCPDIIQVSWLNPEGAAGCLLSHELHIPCVVQSIGSDVNHYLRLSPGRRFLIKDLEKASVLLFVSQELKSIANGFGLSHINQQVIYDGVDIEVFKPVFKLQSDTTKIIVTVANLLPVKNLSLLLKAFAKLS